jgi:hypothetical protein
LNLQASIEVWQPTRKSLEAVVLATERLCLQAGDNDITIAPFYDDMQDVSQDSMRSKIVIY